MKSIFSLILLICLNSCIVFAKYQDCGSIDGKVQSVSLTGCSPSDDTCILKRGEVAGITVKFTSKVDSSSNTIKVSGIIDGVEIPIQLKETDGCKLGLSCPVTKGSSQELKASMPVSTSYPKVNVIIKVQMVDSNGADLFCTQIPSKIE